MLSGLHEFLSKNTPLSRHFIASSPFYRLFHSRYCGVHIQHVDKAHMPICKAKRTSFLDVIIGPWNINPIVTLFLFGMISFPFFFQLHSQIFYNQKQKPFSHMHFTDGSVGLFCRSTMKSDRSGFESWLYPCHIWSDLQQSSYLIACPHAGRK